PGRRPDCLRRRLPHRPGPAAAGRHGEPGRPAGRQVTHADGSTRDGAARGEGIPLRATLPMANVLEILKTHAGTADGEAAWPEASWEALRRDGVLGWCIPTEDGGAGWDATALLDGYARLASACLTTCFILSQRDAAVRRLRDSRNEAVRRELLPALAD